MARGFLCLVAVMDWHSRHVVAWRLSNTLEAGFCAEALEEVLGKGQLEVFNTDQGSQFTSREFTQVLRDRGVRISMDGKGSVLRQHLREAAVAHGEVRGGVLETLCNVLEAQKGREDYFRSYNGLGPHQALGYRTPAEVSHREEGAVEGESNGRRCSPGEGIESLAGASELSLRYPSYFPGPPHGND